MCFVIKKERIPYCTPCSFCGGGKRMCRNGEIQLSAIIYSYDDDDGYASSRNYIFLWT